MHCLPIVAGKTKHNFLSILKNFPASFRQSIHFSRTVLAVRTKATDSERLSLMAASGEMPKTFCIIKISWKTSFFLIQFIFKPISYKVSRASIKRLI